jgi:Cd2+/Zn2+-exporting ATPase
VDLQAVARRVSELLEGPCRRAKKKDGQPCWQEAVQPLHCGGSMTLPNGIRVVAMPEAGVMLERESCPTGPRFWRWHELPLRIRLAATPKEVPPEVAHAEQEWKHGLLLAGICGVLTLLAVARGHLFPSLAWLPIALYALAYIAGGMHPAEEVWELLKKRVLDVHFLMLAVAVGAALIGHWWEGATLLFLFSLSGALEEMAEARTEREIRSLFKDAPKEAVRIDASGAEQRLPVDQVQPGMLLRVRPGEQFAVDGEVVRGASAANESNLTGEALPVEKEPGSGVYGGTINLWGSIDYKVTRPASDSALAKIIRLIKEARESKAPSQRFTDRFGSGYTYLILGLSAAMFFVWWLGFGIEPFVTQGENTSAFYRAMTLLVVASPCALVLSIPSAILAGIAAGARRGVLFRGGAAIESLAEARRFAFDKTGTLTTGELRVERVETGKGSEERLCALGAALAHHSSHPVSRAVVRHAVEKAGVALADAKDFRDLPGNGVEGHVDGVFVRMGRRGMFPVEYSGWFPAPQAGVTEVFVQGDGQFGRFLLRDELRESSAGLIGALRARGVRCAMLTGDRAEAAASAAQSLALDEVHADLKPEDKVELIRKWSGQGERVVMVGDGVNDAPSFAAADVAVGMGMRGADASLEQADIVLMKDRLENLLYAYGLSRRARAIVRQNLAISLGVIVVLVAGALGAAIPLTLGVIGHEGSTVVVVMNSLRLLWSRGK